jgi:hypothetical protein
MEDINGACKLGTIHLNLFDECKSRQAHFDLVATMEPSPLSKHEELEAKLAQLGNERVDELLAAVDLDAIARTAEGIVLDQFLDVYPEKGVATEGKKVVKRRRSKSVVRGVKR